MPKPSVAITQVEFSGGQSFTFSPTEKVLIVGPNNSGKSEFLREIFKILSWHDSQISFENNKVIVGMHVNKSGGTGELITYLEEHAVRVEDRYDYKNYRFNKGHIGFFSQRFIGPIAQIFCKNLGAEGRLGITSIQKGVGIEGHKSKPQHLMYDNQALMVRISALFKRAFRRDLFIDYRGTPDIPIHVGIPPNHEEYPDRVSDAYVNEVRKNPRLDQQGDGMRSYAGILFEVVAIEHDITLLDEPEAFLHPPQMRKLGQTLAEEAVKQIFVATHSSDILRGFLNGANGDVRIIRLERRGDKNHATMTSPARINELWDQPELRYSNALDGVFHEQVVICEDDSDCRLYNSVADHLAKSEPVRHWPDTAYVPSGGKAAIPKIALALNELGVKTKIVTDIDLLSEGQLLRKLVEALGGNWQDFEVHLQRLDAAVRDGIPVLTPQEIKTEISRLIEDSDADALPKSDIFTVMKQTSSWAMIKKHGVSHLPRGDARTTFSTLDELLRGIGIFVVQVGEAENFCPDVGSHGPKFVSKLFQSTPLDSDKLSELRSFVGQLFSD